jgi:hypothetical protein
VSYDWEHLLYSSFVDAKTLVREWLLLIKKRDHADEEDGRGILATLSIASAEESLRVMPSAAAVFARAVLYGDCIFFFEMLAMAYVYLCGAACEEEHEVLVLFCKASYEVRSDDDTVPTTDTDVPPVMSTEGGCVSGGSCEPHWMVLAMLLRRAWNDLMASCNNNSYRYSINNCSLLLDSTSHHQSSLKRSHTGVLFRANTAATVYENSSYRKRTRATTVGGDGVAATRGNPGTPGIIPMTALHSNGNYVAGISPMKIMLMMMIMMMMMIMLMMITMMMMIKMILMTMMGMMIMMIIIIMMMMMMVVHGFRL